MNLVDIYYSLYWREPLWLLVSVQPLIIYLVKRIITGNSASRYADKSLQPWVVIPENFKLSRKLLNKNTLYISGWILLSLSLAGPRTIIHQQEKEQSDNGNIMLVVDSSLSMRATDIFPDRIRRAKTEMYEFIERVKNQRIGIVVYSARPHLYVPLTSDYTALKSYLAPLDKLDFPTSGSDPVSAILLATKELAKLKGHSAIILLTDGDTTSFKDLNQFTAINKLKTAHTPLYILGIGTVEGEAIPLNNGTWFNYQGKPVISRMNEKLLRQLAHQFNGIYSPVLDTDSDWKTIYDDNLVHKSSVKKLAGEKHVLWHELYHYFLILSLLCFVLSLAPWRIIKSDIQFSLLLAFLLFLATPGKNVYATNLFSTPEQFAYQAYSSKNYPLAIEYYKNINGFPGYIGVADSLYKMGHYKEAIPQYSLAMIYATTDHERTNALYNLANSYFHTGNFSDAITTYQDALRYQPGHTGSIYNMEVSKKLYATLLKKINEDAKNILSRQGSGPRTASVNPGTEIENNTSVSLDESTNKNIVNIPLPDIPGTNRDTLKKLLEAGINNVRLAQQERVNSNPTNKVTLHDTVSAQLYINQLTEHPSLLWKRVFEIEEGFPAPVTEAKVIPGVNPW